MRLPKNCFGRPLASTGGNVPNKAICIIVPVMTSGIGGQPGILMTALPPLSTSLEERESVGLGLAA